MSGVVIQLLASYGLGAVAIGTFFEGETVLLASGALCAQGVLAPSAVWSVATVGAWLGHAVWFSLGRRFGRDRIVEVLPKFRARIARAAALIRARPWLFIFVLQYVYGLRMAGSVAFGLSGLPLRWFLAAQALNCGVWAAVIGAAGYLLGESARYLLRGYTRAGWIALAAVVVIVLFCRRNPWRFWRGVHGRRRASPGRGATAAATQRAGLGRATRRSIARLGSRTVPPGGT